MLLIRLNCLQNAPPPWWWWSILEYLVTSLCLCPLVALSLYGAQVYLFLPAEIICIHSQYFKQFSCQIRFADPGKFSISKTNMHISQNTRDGWAGWIPFFLTQVLPSVNCWVHHNAQVFPDVPWPRPPAGFWIFHLNKHSAPASPPGPESGILLWWQCRQYRLVSPGDSLFTETQGVCGEDMSYLLA